MNVDLQNIRTKIRLLYNTNPDVHINISVNRSKTCTQKIKATITGIYPNLFTAESGDCGIKKHYNFQYVDILTGGIEIDELN